MKNRNLHLKYLWVISGFLVTTFCSNSPADLSAALLSVSKEAEVRLFGANVSLARYQKTIDSLAGLLSGDLSGEASDSGKTEILRKFVFEKMAVEPVLDSAGIQGSMITRVLDERKGSCLGLTGLFLLLGRKSGLPLKAVLLPGHVFVRYAGVSSHINIETLRKGLYRSDDFYCKAFGVNQTHPPDLQTLDDRRLTALFQMNLSNEYRRRGLFEDADEIQHRAGGVFPSW